MPRSIQYSSANSAGYLIGIVLILGSIAAWATHIIWVIGKLASDQGATFGQMALGAIGAFMPPVGVVHGIMIWCGFGMG